MADRGATRDDVAVPSRLAEAATTAQIEWLVAEFGPTLYRVAVAIVRDRQSAEDIVQEVLVKAWSSMPSWEGDVPIRWARTVTRNAALSHLRCGSPDRRRQPNISTSIAPLTGGADESVLRAEAADTMWAALARLGEDERAMLVMHEVDGLPYDEIAATLDVTVSAVKSKLYRAHGRVRGGRCRDETAPTEADS